jgi:hypothetical protein
MPRYFFHFSDGKRIFTDAAGVELMSVLAARLQATDQIREMRSALSERTLQDWSDWKLIVADTEGKTVLEVGFDLSTRPHQDDKPPHSPPCPTCRKPMTLAHIVPKAASLRELRTFRCLACGEVRSVAVEHE